MSRAFLVSLLALLSCVDLLANTPCEFKFYTKKGTRDTEDVKALFRGADVLVSRLMMRPEKGKAPPSMYHIVLMDSDDFKGVEILNLRGTDIRFHLPENTGDWVSDDKVAYRIIEGMMLKKSGHDPVDNAGKLPSWLVLGVLGKLRARLCKASVPGIRTYPAVYMLVTDDDPPDLLKIAFGAPAPDTGNPVSTVFMQVSDVLLSAIMRLPKHRESISGLIDLSVRGIEPEGAFVKIFSGPVRGFNSSISVTAKLVDSDDSRHMLADWLLENAILLSVNAFNPARPAFVEKQFRKMDIVKYEFRNPLPRAEAEVEGEKGVPVPEVRYCSLAQLHQKRNEISDFSLVVREKENHLTALEFCAPLILQQPIRELRRTLFNLRSNSAYQYEKHFQEAMKGFFDALQRCHDLAAFLDQYEASSVPESWRYHCEIREIERHIEERRSLWPALSKYLDSIGEK